MSVMPVPGSASTFAMTPEGVDLIDTIALELVGDDAVVGDFRYEALRLATFDNLTLNTPRASRAQRAQWAEEFVGIVQKRVLQIESRGAGRA